MINLEQAKLLETKVAKAIDYIQVLTKENADLRQKETELRQKESELQALLESYQSRIDELEVLVMKFKEDQGVIEDSILAALDRLNQFEEAVEKCLWDSPDFNPDAGSKSAAKTGKQPQTSETPKPAAAIETGEPPLREQDPVLVETIHNDSDNEKLFFEIQETEDENDLIDPLVDTLENELQGQEKELDIF